MGVIQLNIKREINDLSFEVGTKVKALQNQNIQLGKVRG